jgi:hypothetical protein
VRRATETFGLHDRPELSLDAGYNHGAASGPYGSRDWRVDTWLYSQPISRSWRAFAHHYATSASFDGSWTSWVRTGVGAEWRSGSWRASAEVNTGEDERPGILTTLRWQPDDQWRITAAADSLTNDVPLKAVRAGILARRAGVGVDWAAHESRSLSLTSSCSDFTDDNRRCSLGATWAERWLSGPAWTLGTSLGADASHSTLGYLAEYFNPPADHSAWVAGYAEQLVWREFDRSFRHRLTLTAGTYWQSDFGSGGIEAAEYQHAWEVDRNLSLTYGAGRVLRPYDGVRESRTFTTLALVWRF